MRIMCYYLYQHIMVDQLLSKFNICYNQNWKLHQLCINMLTTMKFVLPYTMTHIMTSYYPKTYLWLRYKYMTIHQRCIIFKLRAQILKKSNLLEQQFTQLNSLSRIPTLQKRKRYKVFINMSLQGTTQCL